ncbi:hypothetical protein BGZ59_008136 [Podila verticillata]|nr:hypothetical protein BGZ59_008136 [Podila verticillata]
MMPLLRRIKHKEEDSQNSQTSHRTYSQHSTTPSRNDLDALFTVVSLVYKDRPEASLRYWPIGDDRLHGFLKWGADCKIAARSFFDMIGSLATGTQCAHFAYDFLKSNGGRYGTQSYSAPRTLCSWDKLFEAIELYTNNLNQAMATGGRIEKIRPEEEALLKSMLRLLCTVAQYSVPARCAMNDTKQYRVTHALFRFFICPISVDLKASILDTIAAFAAPTGLGGDNASLVWDYLEQAKILPKSYGTAPEQALTMDKSVVPHRQDYEQLDSGIGYDIQEIETANETYPETIAFANLLSSLIQVPVNPEELLSGGSPTIPALLGNGYRQPGVIPYTRFVLDVIFVKALQRPYRSINEKWKTTQAVRASQHPGFEILTLLLSGGDVLRQIFRILGSGVAMLNKDDQTTPYLKTSILRCFRILSKATQLQDIFIEYIVQVLLTTPSNRNSILSSLAPIEQHLSFNQATVVDIAMYINCDVSNEICSLSIEILDRLSASPLFASGASHHGIAVNRLVRILESSPMSKQILYGFVAKLSADDEESTFEYGASQPDNNNAMILDGPESTPKRAIVSTQPITISSIRLQIMRLLLDNLADSRSSPSITHFLLGYPTETHVTKKSTNVLDDLSNVTLLTVILDLLRSGSSGQEYDQTSPLFVTHPQLAEKCQELIYRLCSDSHTTSATMRYLRTQEAFFRRNLQALPISFGQGLEGEHGVFTSLNGSRFRGNLFNLLSQLYQRSWVMKTSALELRLACESKQRREATGLLSLLYISTDNTRTAGEDDYLYSLTRANNGTLVQPRMKILELLDSIDFHWEDDLKVQDLERYYFADITEGACLEKDDYGVELYNARKLFSLLLARKIQLENDNMITGQGHKNAAHAEIQAIMEQCLARNHARRLEAGRKNAFESWRELVEISLGPGFDLLKLEQRESILYEILEAVLTKIQRGCSADVMTILTKVALCVIQSLRIDHFRQFIFQASSADPQEIDARLPAERLHKILREIIACILRPGNPQSRCNLYSTLVNYFQFTRSDSDSQRGALTNGFTDGSLRQALELNNKGYVMEVSDRLFGIVCQDASDVDQVCKVAAFTLLNTLYGLFEKESTNRVLSHLVQRNYLKHFIEILAREDQELQAAVRGHVSRIPIVSETRMTLFLRIAQHRDGAEHLLEYGYFDVLSNSSTVIDMRSNLNTTDYGLFEQTESNRYHNIVYPMLQVAVAILANLGRSHRRAASKAEMFVASHQDTFASILRDNDFPTTINSLRELRVVTACMNQLAGKTSSSVFGPLHSLVLALIPKYFSIDQWAQSLQPVSDAEKILYATMAPSLTAKAGTTLFERDARSLSRDICKNLLSYSQICTESDRTAAQSFSPIFSWSVSSVTTSHHDSSAMPSLATLLTYLGRISGETQETLARHQTQLAKYNNVSSLTTDEKQNILEASDEPFIDDLVAIQRDQLAVQVLQKMLLTSSQDVDSSLYLLETSLVLLWRHLEYYLGQYAGMLDSSPQAGLGQSRFGQSLGSSFRATTGNASVGFGASVGQNQGSKNYRPTLTEAQSLKRDAGHVVRPVLDNLANLHLISVKPTLEEVQDFVAAKAGNTIPIFAEIQADMLTPVMAYLKVSDKCDYSFLLESIAGGEKIGRYSFIGSDPYKVLKTGPEEALQGDPLTILEKELKNIRYVKVPGIQDFTGGAIGYIGYDNVQYFEPRTKRDDLQDPMGLPDAVFLFCDTIVIFDHLYQKIQVVTHYRSDVTDPAEVQNQYLKAVEEIQITVDLLNQEHTPKVPQPAVILGQEPVSNVGKDGYEGFVTTLKKHIKKGDIIQAVPSQRLAKPTTLHPFNIYRHLRSINPSPYMFYLDLKDFTLVGASPEMLVKVQDRVVFTHPIAGTRKRGATPEKDIALGEELLADPKERAEHIMLVDLGRNDVNRVCKPESVKVDSLMHLERYSHVMHIVSNVSGTLREDKTPFDAFRSIFPAGTTSGAPKVRAMELISELERTKRGVYAGAVGHFNYAGGLDTCIALRTMVVKDGVAYLQAGGGIVYDSVEEDEYQETINKLGSNLTALRVCEEYYYRKQQLEGN